MVKSAHEKTRDKKKYGYNRRITYSRSAFTAVLQVMCAVPAEPVPTMQLGIVKQIIKDAPVPWLEITPLVPVTAEGDAYRSAAASGGGSVVRIELEKVLGGLKAVAHPDFSNRRAPAWKIDQAQLAEILRGVHV